MEKKRDKMQSTDAMWRGWTTEKDEIREVGCDGIEEDDMGWNEEG